MTKSKTVKKTSGSDHSFLKKLLLFGVVVAIVLFILLFSYEILHKKNILISKAEDCTKTYLSSYSLETNVQSKKINKLINNKTTEGVNLYFQHVMKITYFDRANVRITRWENGTNPIPVDSIVTSVFGYSENTIEPERFLGVKPIFIPKPEMDESAQTIKVNFDSYITSLSCPLNIRPAQTNCVIKMDNNYLISVEPGSLNCNYIGEFVSPVSGQLTCKNSQTETNLTCPETYPQDFSTDQSQSDIRIVNRFCSAGSLDSGYCQYLCLDKDRNYQVPCWENQLNQIKPNERFTIAVVNKLNQTIRIKDLELVNFSKIIGIIKDKYPDDNVISISPGSTRLFYSNGSFGCSNFSLKSRKEIKITYVDEEDQEHTTPTYKGNCKDTLLISIE